MSVEGRNSGYLESENRLNAETITASPTDIQTSFTYTISNSAHTNTETSAKFTNTETYAESTTPKPIQSNPLLINSYAFFNVQGLCPQTVQSKVPFIKNNICNKNLLFIGLSETWLHKGHKEAELQIENFTLFRCDSSRKKKNRGRYTGGVCFYVREDIGASCEELYSFSSKTVQLLCLHSKVENLALVVAYRQPDDRSNGNPSTANDFTVPLNGLKLAISTLETTPNIVFGGDFNLPRATWPAGLPKPGCPLDERVILNSLNQFCNDLFISQYVRTATHKDGNILDLVFTNNGNIIHNCTTIPVLQSTSHHKIVLVSTCLKVSTISEKDEQPEPRTGFNTLNFCADEVNWQKIKERIRAIKWKEKHSEDPNEILETINTLCFEICKENVPTKSSKEGKRRSKVERHRRTLSKRRRKITKRLLHSNSQTQKDKIRKELLQIEKKLQKSFKESKQFVEMKAIESIKKNSKYFFAYAKKQSKIKTNIGPLADDHGNLTMKSKEMADILAKQYA